MWLSIPPLSHYRNSGIEGPGAIVPLKSPSCYSAIAQFFVEQIEWLVWSNLSPNFTHHQINSFACKGLRTLAFGQRVLDAAEYNTWSTQFKNVSNDEL